MNNKKIGIAIIILIGLLFILIPETYGEFFNSSPTSSVPIDTNNNLDIPSDTYEEENNLEVVDDSKYIEDAIDYNDIDLPPVVDSSKKVFLTFDDGPTRLTPKVLEILKEHEVHATFFTIGKMMERYPGYVLKAYREGHMILPHSYSHDFSIYTTFETFYDDFYKAEDVYRYILGFDPPPYFRFPGGSSNHTSFRFGGKQFMPRLTEDIKEKGYYYIDWNVYAGDTTPDYNNSEKMLQNIFRNVNNNDFAIILFHDLEKNVKTVEILPEVIERLKDKGYIFRTFRDVTEEELDTMVRLKLANKPIRR